MITSWDDGIGQLKGNGVSWDEEDELYQNPVELRQKGQPVSRAGRGPLEWESTCCNARSIINIVASSSRPTWLPSRTLSIVRSWVALATESLGKPDLKAW